MGTPLREVIDLVGGGPRRGRRIKAVMPGVSNGLIPEHLLDTPASYEAMAAIGSGLGAGGFLVFDDTDDLAAVAAGVSRFLAVESCGQCTPCKRDGLALAELLERFCESDDVTERDLAKVRDYVSTVGDEARCYLATQHQVVVGSILEKFGDDVAGHVGTAGRGTPRAATPDIVAELVDIAGDEAVVDTR